MKLANRPKKRSWYVLLCAMVLLSSSLVWAHPMGNFSVNQYTQIGLRSGAVEILYVVDMAEIPTYQEIQEAGIVARAGDPSLTAYLPAKGNSLKAGLVLEVDGQRLPLRLVSQQVIFPPGAGGLPTLKMGFVYRAELSGTGISAKSHLRYSDLNFSGHAGWKEIIVDSPAAALVSSSVPKTDRSNRLSNYPTDLLNSPPQDLQAEIVFAPVVLLASAPAAPAKTHGGSHPAQTVEKHSASRGNTTKTLEANVDGSVPPANSQSSSAQPVQLQPNQQATPRSSFTELISRKNLSFWFLVLAAVISAGLGALHALEPGHGKTIVAAYLVGSRGTARHALLLGMIVTSAHTAGVYLLGAITLYAQRYILPERIYPFLGVLSGILIAGMGCYLLLQHYLGAEFAHTHSYERPAGSDSGKTNKRIKSGELFLLGITGGMVPCPGALVVLLSAVALHRTGLGLFLIVAFSIGLAAVLIAMGMAAVYAGRLLSRFRLEGPLFSHWLPLASASIVTVLGFGITLRALMAAGIIHIRF